MRRAEPPERLSVTLVEEDGDWSGFGLVEEAIRRLRGTRSPLALRVGARQRGQRRARQRCAGAPPEPTYRGKDAPTNVLSFPFQSRRARPDDGAYLGDVVLAAETVRRRRASAAIEPGTISSTSSFTACCICWAMTIEPTPRRRRWSAWRPRFWPRSASPTLTPSRRRPDR
jgi:hypothetical protein